MNGQIEIERKYIIKLPDFDVISAQADYTVSRITQIYISSPDGVTHRVRSRAYLNSTVYTETKKIRIDSMSAFEDEREIGEEDFFAISKNIKNGTRPIIKTRHTFRYGALTFEIDVYPEWENTAIMETELENREIKAEIPPFINIIADVTGDYRYSNSAMSQKFPKEII